MKVNLNPNIRSDFEGYSHLIRLYLSAKASDANEINFSFENTSWFEANLSAVLGAIIELLEDEGKSISISSINPIIRNVLIRNGFLGKFGEVSNSNANQTIVSYKKFNPVADEAFMDYIKTELLSKPDFPKHSPRLGKKINESIFELYENARTHGRCKQIHTCGQYYPNKKPKLLDITIVDMGKTIKANVNDFLNENLTGAQAIEWALEYGNTTKTGNISGGLGLDIIQEFIKLNNGKIQIISSDGYWEFRRGKTKKMHFQDSFPGTIANLEFNLDDRSVYQLTEEISLDDIFLSIFATCNNSNMVLVIKDIIKGDTAVSTDDGDVVYKKIVAILKLGTPVELDFSGINIMTTAFLNAAIGQLYSAFNSEQLNSLLKLVNVAADDRILFKKVIERAKEYFLNKKGFEDSANKAIYGS